MANLTEITVTIGETNGKYQIVSVETRDDSENGNYKDKYNDLIDGKEFGYVNEVKSYIFNSFKAEYPNLDKKIINISGD